jgi:internalin A
MSAVPVARPWRRHLRSSVRSLIVLILLSGLWLGWFVRSARIQRDAVAAVKRARGEVLYSWQWQSGHWIPVTKPLAPIWLVGAIGIDHFGSVVWVRIPSPSEQALSAIVSFDQLQTLIVTGEIDVTDTALANLKRLTNLRTLDLRGTGRKGHNVRDLEPFLPKLQIIF